MSLAILAVPMSAHAGTIYPPSNSCTTSPATTVAGGTVEFSCAAETFSGDERVTITVTGENGDAARIGMVHFTISTASGFAESGADGSLAPVAITLPSDSSGTYNIAAISPTSAGGTAAATIAATDGLPTTGSDSGSLMGAWIGGGALVAAGAVLVFGALARRRRNAD